MTILPTFRLVTDVPPPPQLPRPSNCQTVAWPNDNPWCFLVCCLALDQSRRTTQKLVEVDTGENELAANDTGGTSQPASQPGSTATSPRPSLCRVGSKRKPDNGTGVHQSESRIEHGGGEPTGQTNLGIGDMSHGDEPCRGGIGGRCSCVMTYEGEITGLSSQVRRYIMQCCCGRVVGPSPEGSQACGDVDWTIYIVDGTTLLVSERIDVRS